MKKSLYIIIILFIVFIGTAEGLMAKAEVEYTDTGLTINNNKIFINSNIESNSGENNICIASAINEKECILKTKICMYKCENLILSVDNKGIFYMEDEFNLKFYDLKSKKEEHIISGIYKLLSKYEIDKNEVNFMDDHYFNSFTDKSLNPEKNKLAVEIVYNDDETMSTVTHMVCIVDINKLSAGDENYIECPIITNKMKNFDSTKVPDNTWKNDQLPVLNGWTDNKAVEITTKKGDDFVLNTDDNKLESKSGNVTSEYTTALAAVLSLLGVLGILGFVLAKRGKKRRLGFKS